MIVSITCESAFEMQKLTYTGIFLKYACVSAMDIWFQPMREGSGKINEGGGP